MRVAPSTLLVLLLLAVPLASASEPVMPPSVWLVHTTVDAVVRDNYATVKVIADISNRGPDPEFPFVVRIPDDAFVTGLTIERDGQVFEAAIKDRATARAEYEDWKAQQQTGGLVERARRTSVYSYLINVAEFTSVRATLTYERYLAADRGVFNLSLEAPVSGFGEDTGATFRVLVQDASLEALWGEPAATRVGSDRLELQVGPRRGVESPTPFTASYSLGHTPDAGTLTTTVVNGTGYFAHRFRATDDAPQLPMDLVLVLDVSGSMAGEKLRQMIDAAKQVVGTLDGADRLELVAFSSDARAAWDGPLAMTPENRRKAVAEIDALFDGGGTNIEAGLRTGFESLASLDWREEEGRFPAIVLLTDGQPTVGVTSRSEILSVAQRLNVHDVPVFGIAFGDDADWTLIRHLAEDGEGAAIRVPPGTGAEVDLRRFMAALTTPVLRDVSISYGPGVTAYRAGAPVLFAGSELLVVGTFDPELGIAGTVTGWSPTGERRFAFDGGSPGRLAFLPRLVAYQEVRELQEQEGAEGATPATTARIVELAVAHGFVTDHTSLVLTPPRADVRPFVAQESAATSDDSTAWRSRAPSGGAAGAPTASTQPWMVDVQDDPYAATDSDLVAEGMGTSPTWSGPGATPMGGHAESAEVPAAGGALLLVALLTVALALRGRRTG